MSLCAHFTCQEVGHIGGQQAFKYASIHKLLGEFHLSSLLRYNNMEVITTLVALNNNFSD